MTDSDEVSNSSRNWPQVRTAPLVTGGTLVAVGGLHLIAATREWIGEMEVPPSELARLHWSKAKAGFSAGVGAYQNGTAPVVVVEETAP